MDRLGEIAGRPEGKTLARSSALREFVEEQDAGVDRPNPLESDMEPGPAVEGDGIFDVLDVSQEPNAKEKDREAAEGSSSRAARARQAKAAVGEGRQASKRGQWAEAKMHFHRALTHRPGHPEALAGLAEVEFQNSAYEKAASLIQDALARSPRNKRYWVFLGDTKVKVFDYAAGRRAYEKAAELGSRTAPRRLKWLDAKTGD